jgi:aspartyl-tRNA(Asn)/glutamyl-tRNA(Gln) amidotransferase subunit C
VRNCPARTRFRVSFSQTHLFSHVHFDRPTSRASPTWPGWSCAEESERMLTQLNGFFDIVEQMRAVDTTGIEPLAHPFATISDIALRLRDDVVSEPDQRDANQRSAPAVEAACSWCPRSSNEDALRHAPH